MIDETNEEIADKIAKENRDIIVNNCKQYSEHTEKINNQEMWKLLKKL